MALLYVTPDGHPTPMSDAAEGVSTRRLRREHGAHLRNYLWDDHLWSPSSFAGPFGAAPLTVVHEYIENQKRPGG
jgi:putative transposase